MPRKSAIKVSIGGLIVYLVLAFWCACIGDMDHAGMFVAGAAIWIACIFIWAAQGD